MRRKRKQEPKAFQFETLDAFVEQFIAPTFERALNTTATWCPQWWRHDGAAVRLTALWLAWEHQHATGEADGPAKWFAYYAGPIMREVMDPEGTFKGCSVEHGHKERRPHPDGVLPCEPAPAGLYAPRR